MSEQDSAAKKDVPKVRDPDEKAKSESPPVSDAEVAVEDETEDESIVQDELASLETVDMVFFQQVLDLDEDETHDFSKPMVWQFFEQADETFGSMDQALESKELVRLSELGHFLKSSSSQLGLSRVLKVCEKIEYTGKDAKAGKLEEEVSLKRIKALLKTAKAEYEEAENWLKKWYEEN